MPTDLNVSWGGQLQITAGGDLQMATGPDFSVQRVMRRIFTTPAVRDLSGRITQPGGDVFSPDYGAGLATDVMMPSSPQRTRQRTQAIMQSLAQEDSIDKSVIPTVQFVDLGPSTQLLTVQFNTIQGQQAQLKATV